MENQKLQSEEIQKINSELKRKFLSIGNNRSASGFYISNGEDSFLNKGGQAYVYRLLDRKGKKSDYVLKVYEGRYSEYANKPGDQNPYKKAQEKNKDIKKLKNERILVPETNFDDINDRYIVVERYHKPLTDYVPEGAKKNRDDVQIAFVAAICLLEGFIDLSTESGKLKHAIYHCDVKPENILMAGKEIHEGLLLTDFGVAAYDIDKGGGTITDIGIGGSYATMSPEVYNRNITNLQKSDMYSIGMTLYYYLSGCYPGGAAKDDVPIHKKRLSNKDFPIDPPAKGSSSFKKLVMKAMAYDPKDRFDSYTEMYEELKRCEEYSRYIAQQYGNGVTVFVPASKSIPEPVPDPVPVDPNEDKQHSISDYFLSYKLRESEHLLRPYCVQGESPRILYEKIKKNVTSYFGNKYLCKFYLSEKGLEIEFGDNIDFAPHAQLTAYYEQYINIFKELLYKVKVNSDSFFCSEENFENCENLQIVELSANVKYFNPSAFRKCSGITSFWVDEENKFFDSDRQGVLYKKHLRHNKQAGRELLRYPIGNPCKEYDIHYWTDKVDPGAFSGCRYLETLIIPASVRDLGELDLDDVLLGDFYYSVLPEANSLKKFKVSSENPKYSSDSHGVLFDKYKTVLIKYPSNAPGYSYSVPATVKTIKRDAFSKCFNLKEIIVTNTLKNTYADETKLNLDGVRMVSSGKSAKEPMTPKRRAKIRKRILIAVLLLFIGQLAFKGTQELLKVFDAGVCNNGIYWVYNNNKNRLAVSSFAYGTGRMDYYSENDETIPWNDFKDEIQEVVVKKDVYQVSANAFRNCRNLEYAKISSKYGVADSAFEGCTNLETVEIRSDSDLASIGENAFLDCEKLTDITIPSSVTDISESAFVNTAVYNDESNWDNGVFYVNNHLLLLRDNFYGEVEIREGTTTIADLAFSNSDFDYDEYGYYGVTTLTIPSSVEKIGSSAFYNTRVLEKIIVDQDNKNFYSDLSGVLFAQESALLSNNKFYELLCFPSASTKESYTIPEGVSIIGYGAFHCCKNLESIIISESVRTFEERAFEMCTEIKDITIPKSVKDIDYTAFFSCSSLERFVVDEENKKFSSDSNGVLYRKKKGLFSDDKLESIVKFPQNNILTAFTVPDGISEVESNCFADADSLQTITLPDSIEKIDFYAFSHCDNLKELTIPKNAEDIGDTIFYDSGVERITVSGITEIDREVLDKFIKDGIEIDTY